jgi:two-component system OmpR family response regulator
MEEPVRRSSYEVLIVDDEVNICNALRRILGQEGYLVKAVLDGNTALDVISKKRTDVVLLDLMMPGINGREICSMARHMAVDTRVIYFTAFAGSSLTGLKELEGEADGFIRKPASAKKILAKLNAVLNTSNRSV